MFKTVIFKEHNGILKDKYTKDTRGNKGPTTSNAISATFNSLGKMFHQRT